MCNVLLHRIFVSYLKQLESIQQKTFNTIKQHKQILNDIQILLNSANKH